MASATLLSGAAIGGRFLAPHATKLTGKLLKRFTYRNRVARKVRKSSKVDFPKKPFKEWLRRLSEDDLNQPIEVTGVKLAQDLDNCLADHSEAWKRREKRASKSLIMVEETFMAILSIEDEVRYRELVERWAGRRNEEIISKLVEVSGGYSSSLSNSDLCVWLKARSDARRDARLSSFFMADAKRPVLSFQESRGKVPDAPPGEVRVIVGKFGSGKTEIAEEWHRESIERCIESDNYPIPVWIHARQSSHRGIESTLIEIVGPFNFHGRGVCLVVDGLDEADPIDAEAIMRDALVFVKGNSRSSVLLTTRPNVISVVGKEIYVDGLSGEESIDLVRTISGDSTVGYDWPVELLESIKSPFFALSAGLLIASGKVPSGEAQIIDQMVQMALQGDKRANVGDSEIFAVLSQLGAELTRSGGRTDGLSFSERGVALASRLTVKLEDGRIGFSLPIFEQWFAAQKILSDATVLGTALKSPLSFGLWRWALSMAVLSSTEERVDQIIEAVLRFNVGAGTWLIESVDAPLNWNREEREDLDQDSSDDRILNAICCWRDSLGRSSSLFLPFLPDGPIVLGVSIGKARVFAVGVSFDETEVDRVVALPSTVHPLLPPSDQNSNWRSVGSFTANPGHGWTWSFVKDLVSRNVLPVLDGLNLLGPQSGVWQEELIWRAARIISGNSNALHKPILREDILGKCSLITSGMLEMGVDLERTDIMIHSKRVPGRDIKALVNKLANSEEAWMVRPLPAPDREFPQGGGIEGFYTEKQLVRFCSESMGKGLQAYQEAADEVFSAFDWSLGMHSVGPVGVVGEVVFNDTGTPVTLRDVPIVQYRIMPLEIMENRIEGDESFVRSENCLGAFRSAKFSTAKDWFEFHMEVDSEIQGWLADHGITGPFSGLSSGSTDSGAGHSRPASQHAARWLWGDFKKLSLDRGTFPQLDR